MTPLRIRYFSGTGNSYYAAKSISEAFSHVDVQAIRKDLAEEIRDGVLVVVCPLYYYGMPHIVNEYIRSSVFGSIDYLSVIFTAEFPNGLAISMLKTLGEEKGVLINSCFYLRMPTNYLIKSKMLEPDTIELVLNAADEKLDKIIEVIRNRSTHLEKDSKLYSLLVKAKKSLGEWENRFPTFDSNFIGTKKCVSCGLCQENCPVGNIQLVEKRPLWRGHCEACLRCISTCPAQAIQYGDATEGRTRYFNPRVHLAELMRK